jgi:hypothetical protein
MSKKVCSSTKKVHTYYYKPTRLLMLPKVI